MGVILKKKKKSSSVGGCVLQSFMANFCLLLDSCVFVNSRIAKLQTKLIFYRSRVLTKESKQHSCDGRTLPIRQAEQMLDMPDQRVTSSVVVALFG